MVPRSSAAMIASFTDSATAVKLASATMPVHRTRHERVRAKRAAEDRGDVAGAGEEGLEVDAGVDAHLVEHRHEVLGRDVAGGARRHRAAAELAEAGLIRLAARLERGEDVRESLPAGVVEVGRQLDVVAERRACVREEAADLARVRHAGGVAEGDLLGPGVAQAPGNVEHALLGHVALVGAPEADADDALAAQPRVARAAEHRLEPAERLLHRAVDVLAVVGLAGAEEDVDLLEALPQLERVLQAALVGD